MASDIEFLAHTADTGLLIGADTLAELFRAAADGLFQLTASEEARHTHEGATQSRELRLHADDAALLLIAWLRELLYLHQAEQLCITRMELPVVTEQDLVAVLHCASCSAPQREIKAVTYHQLGVTREQDRWHARVIFDV